MQYENKINNSHLFNIHLFKSWSDQPETTNLNLKSTTDSQSQKSIFYPAIESHWKKNLEFDCNILIFNILPTLDYIVTTTIIITTKNIIIIIYNFNKNTYFNYYTTNLNKKYINK